MVHNDQDGAVTEQAELVVTLASLREDVARSIEQLGQGVFTTLRETSTESLLVYTIVVSLRPIVNKYQENSHAIDELLKAVWPTDYAIIKDYLKKFELAPAQLVTSVHHLLEIDDFAARVFETLLIFTEVVPLLEEEFHLRESMLWEFRRELREWQHKGKFQRLDVTIPSEQLEPPSTSRGDLHIAVSASKPTIVAGQEFSVFVVINNPFEIPVVLHSVETQIPVEIVDLVARQHRRLSLIAEEPSFRRPQRTIRDSILHATRDQWWLNLRMATEPDNRIAQAVAASEVANSSKRLELVVQQEISSFTGGSVIGAQIERFQSVDIDIDSVSPQHLDRILWRIDSFKRGLIPIVLQPGDSIVKQFIFRTRSWLFFTPLAHKLQIQVRYNIDERDHLDTVPYELTIQAAITATMTGAIIGGLAGGIARLLSELQAGTQVGGGIAQFVSVLLAMILSAIVVVSFARKSGVQQIVSVEDFWGGLFIGFLIGFLGQNFALNLLTPNAAGNDTTSTLTAYLSRL